MRRNCLKAAVFFVMALAMSQNLTAMDRSGKPNVVYMMLDEWGYYEMSGLGHQKLTTPVFDEFMKEGMRFTQCCAGGPVCGPTRSTLLTGQHLGHVSMRGNGGGTPIREDEVTIAEILKDQGYRTAGFGKWGIGAGARPGFPKCTASISFSGITTRFMPTLSIPHISSAIVKKCLLRGTPAIPTKVKRTLGM